MRFWPLTPGDRHSVTLHTNYYYEWIYLNPISASQTFFLSRKMLVKSVWRSRFLNLPPYKTYGYVCLLLSRLYSMFREERRHPQPSPIGTKCCSHAHYQNPALNPSPLCTPPCGGFLLFGSDSEPSHTSTACNGLASGCLSDLLTGNVPNLTTTISTQCSANYSQVTVCDTGFLELPFHEASLPTELKLSDYSAPASPMLHFQGFSCIFYTPLCLL